VTLSNAAAASPTFTAPSAATASTLSFRLIVSDGTNSSPQDTVAVNVAALPPPPPPPPPSGSNLASVGTPIVSVPAPIGGGNHNIAIIRDGVKPAAGSYNMAAQYDTYHGSAPSTSEWVGYTFPSTYTFNRVVFQEGHNFFDGGWFDTLTVQVRQSGTWVTVTGLGISPVYPGNNGVNFETFTLVFTPMLGDGVRIFGAPGGSADFFSIAELEVYASN
jgi:hypothetical protein